MLQKKTKKMLSEFFERNKNYSVNAYVRNGITGCFIVRQTFSIDRSITLTDHKFQIESNTYNGMYVPYEEVFDCYEGKDEFGSQTVVVILKNEMKMEFECCGDRM